MPYDYSTAQPARSFDTMPAGTIVTVSLHLRPGGAGEDGILKRSARGDCEMIDAELTVTDGEFKGRKVWEYWILEGTSAGQQQAAEISRSTLKAILDATRGLEPNDMSAEVRAKRTVELKDFEGATFMVKLGVEKGKPKLDSSNQPTGESWPDKNNIAAVMVRGMADWKAVEQPPPFDGAPQAGNSGGASSAVVQRPDWA